MKFVWTDFKDTQISNFVKIRLVGAEFHADRHDEADSRFSLLYGRA